MIRCRTLLQKISHNIPFKGGLLPGNSIEQPLLTREEILQLFYKVVQRNAVLRQDRDVAHNKIGDLRSVYRGYGLDFEESRPYMAGDELRYMNWRLTARTGQPYMKVFREERRPGAFMLIDRRASMRFGSRVRLKATQALRAAAIAAFSAQTQQLPISGVILEQQPRWISELAAEPSAFRLLQAASSACPPYRNHVDEPSLHSTMKLLLTMLAKGSRIYLVSDFHDLDDTARPLLLQLATDHQVIAVHIYDEIEKQLPVLGKLQFASSTDDRAIYLNTSEQSTRNHYAELASIHFKQCKGLFDAMGIPYLLLGAHRDDIENSIPLL